MGRLQLVAKASMQVGTLIGGLICSRGSGPAGAGAVLALGEDMPVYKTQMVSQIDIMHAQQESLHSVQAVTTDVSSLLD